MCGSLARFSGSFYPCLRISHPLLGTTMAPGETPGGGVGFLNVPIDLNSVGDIFSARVGNRCLLHLSVKSLHPWKQTCCPYITTSNMPSSISFPPSVTFSKFKKVHRLFEISYLLPVTFSCLFFSERVKPMCEIVIKLTYLPNTNFTNINPQCLILNSILN